MDFNIKYASAYRDLHRHTLKKDNVCPDVCIIKRRRTVKCTSKEIKKEKRMFITSLVKLLQ